VHYRAYGLTLSSTVPFPELPPIRARRAALRFRLASGRIDPHGWIEAAPRLLSGGDPWLIVAKRGPKYRLRFGDRADLVLMRDGRTLVGYRHGHTPLIAIRQLFLDQALPMVLSHLGRTVLHASAVAWDGGAVALLGPAGAGKSTLAASLAVNGWPVIADDAVLLRRRGDEVLTTPAYASLRICSDALTVMGRGGRPPRVSPVSGKWRIGPGDPGFTFCDRPAPLRRIYLLDSARGPQSRRIRIEALSRRESVIELIKYSYVMDVTDRAQVVDHLDRLMHECAPIGLRRLTYPRDLAALPRVQAAILRDLRLGSDERSSCGRVTGP
jgi:hypothetical protein